MAVHFCEFEKMTNIFCLLFLTLLAGGYSKELNLTRHSQLEAKFMRAISQPMIKTLGYVKVNTSDDILCAVGVFSVRTVVTAASCLTGLDKRSLEVFIFLTQNLQVIRYVQEEHYQNPIVVLLLTEKIDGLFIGRDDGFYPLDGTIPSVTSTAEIHGWNESKEGIKNDVIIKEVDYPKITSFSLENNVEKRGDLLFYHGTLIGILYCVGRTTIFYQHLLYHIDLLHKKFPIDGQTSN